ncbi:MAG: serine/threonine-protein kinase [Myxococcaceae bacterium]|nr:serine/threonine-protein kinase [Myxococcaceae bacterium]
MTREDRLWALFDECLALTPSARDQRLAHEADRDVADEVLRLLRADASPAALSGIAGQALAALVEPPPAIPGFTLLRELGRGGFGTVYLALQHAPSRTVAVKVLRAAQHDASGLERFRLEGDALALLSHPNVPRVFAVGETDGRRWLAMELVRGEGFDVWARPRSLAERLVALETVARAVHAAHLRGVVHRDLKPENVVVTADGAPRVLDFGIARPVGEATPAAGTRAYMSPEQREGRPVDGRADVFALGVMLRELATTPMGLPLRRAPDARSTADSSREGQLLPTDVDRRTTGARTESDDARHADPRPGLATPGPPEATAPAALALAPELASVVRMATAPLEDRYDSAQAFADDLVRFRSRDVVRAHPSTPLYRLRCLVRRNGLGLAAATLVVLSLATAAAVFRAQSLRAERERARADAIRTFLSATLERANPLTGSGPRVTVVEAIDAAARRLDDGSLAPDVEVDLRETLSKTYASLGQEVAAYQQAQKAVALLDRAGGSDDEQRARLLRGSADFGAHAGAVTVALEWLARADVLERHHGRPHLHLAQQGHTRGEVLMDAGRLAEAIAAFEDALTQLEPLWRAGDVETDDYTSVMNQEAAAHGLMGHFEVAQGLYERALELDTKTYGAEHLQVANDLHNLAWLALRRGDAELALERSRQSRRLRVAKLGARHHRLGLLRLVEAEALSVLGRCDDAVRFAREGLSILENAVGAEATRALRGQFTLASVKLACGDVDVLPEVQRATQALASRMGPGQWWVLEGRVVEAEALRARGDLEAAQALARSLVEDLERQLGPDAPLLKRARSAAKDD